MVNDYRQPPKPEVFSKDSVWTQAEYDAYLARQESPWSAATRSIKTAVFGSLNMQGFEPFIMNVTTYGDAVTILGRDGKVVSQVELGGVSTIGYSWKNPNGSNIVAIFQNGLLVSKAQAGL